MTLRIIIALALVCVTMATAQVQSAPPTSGSTVQLPTASARFQVPEGSSFLQKDEANTLLRQKGFPNPDVDALLASTNEDLKWYLSFKFLNIGYFKTEDVQDDLAEINVAEEAKKKTATEQKQRELNGLVGVEFIRMIEQPSLNTEHPTLDYSFETLLDTTFTIERRTIFFTSKGLLLCSLTCPHAQYTGVRPITNAVFASLTFDESSRYSAFDPNNGTYAADGIGKILFVWK